MNALRTIFPGARLTPCWFHMNQALYRHLVECGLMALYREVGGPLNKWVKQLMVLPFVRPDRVRKLAKTLIMARPFSIRPEEPVPEGELDVYSAVHAFASYYWHTWAKTDALHPVAVWTQFHNHSNKFTSNDVEGWHNGIKAHFKASTKPNLWTFIMFLQDEELAVNTKCVQISTGRATGLTARRRTRNRNGRMDILRWNYEQAIENIEGDESIAIDLEFLLRLKNNVHQF